MKESKSLMSRLLKGEQVICKQCGKGVYKPFKPNAKVNHYYICDNCGAQVHWDPVVDIE